MNIPIVRTITEYYTEWVDLIEFLKNQPYYEVVNNREIHTVDIRLSTLTSNLTHYVAHIPYDDIEDGDIEWMHCLKEDNRVIEFVEKYAEKVIWPERHNGCSIDTFNVKIVKSAREFVSFDEKTSF